jgi:glycosyltransferase involved in cell wall biosynthesis
MKRIAILSPSLTTADAVSNDVMGEFDVLSRQGNEVRLFCETHSLNHPQLFDVAHLARFLKNSDDILIYHFSRGWSPGLELIRELRCRRVIRYHNITPAEFFVRFSRTDQEICEAGRRELVELIAARCDLFLSASAFSMRELIAIGADSSRSLVAPPFHHIDRLSRITADVQTLQKYSDGAANILSVGRVVPHKGVHQLIAMFARYYYDYNRHSRLLIVGKGGEGLSDYSRLLHRAVHKLRLDKAVVFMGGVSDEVLKACYLVANAFATTSEHEGFCVPLVEAMSMKLPITAYASTASPETLGDAGIAWPDREPLLMAESINLFVKDPAVRHALGLRGRDRYEAMFTNEKIEQTFVNAISRLQ